MGVFPEVASRRCDVMSSGRPEAAADDGVLGAVSGAWRALTLGLRAGDPGGTRGRRRVAPAVTFPRRTLVDAPEMQNPAR